MKKYKLLSYLMFIVATLNFVLYFFDAKEIVHDCLDLAFKLLVLISLCVILRLAKK